MSEIAEQQPICRTCTNGLSEPKQTDAGTVCSVCGDTWPGRRRKVKNSALKTYLWERVPRQLLEDATAKAKAMDPPLSLKALLIKLLREWTYGEVK